MEAFMHNLYVTALIFGGVFIHALAKAREIDRATPKREPLAKVLVEVLWGDDSRWRTIMVSAAVLVVGLSGSASLVLAMAGVQISEAAGEVMIYGGAGYSIDSIGKKLQSAVSPKASA